MRKINLLVPAKHIPSLETAAQAIDNAVDWKWLPFNGQANDANHMTTVAEIGSFLGQKSCDFVILPSLPVSGPVDYPDGTFYAVQFPQWLPENGQHSAAALKLLLQYVHTIWHTGLAADRHENEVNQKEQHLQEYEAYCQVLGDLISVKSERTLKKIMPRLLNDFFKSDEYHFWSYEQLHQARSGDYKDLALAAFAASKDSCKLTPSDPAGRPDGFMIKVESTDGLLGIISLQKLAVPENLDRYIQYATNIARTAAIVITNSRRYRAFIDSEQKLKYSSTHDSLTELYNRPAFNEKITALAESDQSWPVAIFTCDINGLKQLNDLYGHTEGDRLILRAADVLRQSFRENDFIARIGGDEFSILLPNCSKSTAEQIRSRMKNEISANNRNHLYPLSLAVGYIIWSGPEISYDHALMLADIAMYDDKQNTKLQPASLIYHPGSAEAGADAADESPKQLPAVQNVQLHPQVDDRPPISARQYQQIFDNMFTGYALHEMIYDENGRACDYRFIDMNPAFEKMTGYNKNTCLGRSILTCSPQTDDYWIRRYADVVQSGRHAHFEQYAAAISKYFEIYAFRTELNHFATLVLDVSQRKQMELELAASEARYRSVIANISDVICIIDSDDKIRYVSPNIRRWFGWDAEQLIGRRTLDLVDPASAQKIAAQKERLLSSELAAINERVQIRCRDGNMKDIELTAVNLKNNQHIKGILVNFRDISEQVKSEQELRHLSTYDSLTGLYNREYFDQALQKFFQAEDLPFCLVLGDVNGLRLINNSFGIESGNRTLAAIADVLRSVVPEKAVVARVGGDEFAILLPQTVLEEARQLSQKIKQACTEYRRQTEADMSSVFASMTLGYACQESAGMTIGQLFQQAENLLYRRKLLERKSLYSTLLTSIKATMFAKSFETESHAARMVELSAALGQAAGLDTDQLSDLSLFATLHDLGKISIDNQILDKPGRLTEAEWTEIKKHPEIGHQIAISTPDLTPIAHLILTHHERWDGTGYPQRLQGQAIPLLSRLLAIVDAYDAMTQDRPYRQAMPVSKALEEIAANAGIQFDPDLAGYFIRLINEKTHNPQTKQNEHHRGDANG